MTQIFSLFDPGFWLFSVLFVIAGCFSWYAAGSWAVRSLKITPLSHVVMALVVGLVLWAGQGYIAGYVGWRWLTYGYLAISAFSLWKNRQWEWLLWQKLSRQLTHAPGWWLVVAVGTFIQLIPVASSGLIFDGQLPFYGVNAYDGVLHLAYIQELAHHFPPQEPGALGLALVNYHFWSDLVMAELARVWQLPVIHLYFQWLPLAISGLTSAALYSLVRTWGGSKSWATWAVIFNYTVGDLAYALSWWFHREFWWHVAAIDNGSTQFLNVPHTFAKLILIVGMMALWHWWQHRQWRWGLVMVLLLGSLAGFKIYYGMFAAVGLSMVVVVDLIRSRFKPIPWQSLGLLALTGVLAMLIFFPTNRHSGGLFYSPLEWPKILLGPDHLNVRDWWLRRQNYEAAGSWKGLLYQDSQAILICLMVIYGTRLLGFLPTKKLFQHWGWALSAFTIPGTLLFTWLGLYTLQTSGLFNVFNFFVVACVPLSLVTSFWLAEWWDHRWQIGKVVVIAFMALTTPKIMQSTWYYTNLVITQKPEQKLTQASVLMWQKVGQDLPATAVFQAIPSDNWNRITPMAAFFSQRPTYLTGSSMLESHNQPITERQAALKTAFAASSPEDLAAKLNALGVTHLYVPTSLARDVTPAQHFTVVAETADGKIYQVP